MKMKRIILYLILAAFLINNSALAKTIYVDSESVQKADGTSWTSAFLTIQDGIDDAVHGDHIIVRPRTSPYGSTSRVNISDRDYCVAITNDIIVSKENGSSLPLILDASDTATCVYMTDGTLEDFILINGSGSNGGGAHLNGGGLLSRCLLSDNNSVNGGGAYLFGNADMQDCLIVDNNATSRGGGVYLIGVGNLINCTVSDNSAGNVDGTQLYCNGGGSIANCILYDHSPQTGETVFHPDSASVSHTCSPDGVTDLSNGCLTAPPHFLSFGRVDNYRLLSTSPCIDMGDNSDAASLDLDNDPRIEFNTVDMGAYESTSALITLYVDDTNSSDDYNGRGPDSAKQTLQAAIDAAPTDGTVRVSSGTYRYGSATNAGADGTETNRVVLTQNVTLESIYGPESTTISGENSLRGAIVYSGCTLDGFTIEDGTSERGGGVVLMPGAVMTNCIIQNCQTFGYPQDGGGLYLNQGGTANNSTIRGCTATEGGGIYVHEAGTLNDCLIENNRAENGLGRGGGVYLEYGGTLNRCRILSNEAESDGGGVYMVGGTLNRCIIQHNNSSYCGAVSAGGGSLNNPCCIRNCLVSHNEASAGWGGLYMNEARGEIVGCTVAENQDPDGYGSQLCVSTTNIIRNCIFAKENAEPGETQLHFFVDPIPMELCCIYGETNVYTNCITGNPQFVDAENGNFALNSGSPCIDAGTNSVVVGTTDVVGNLRIRNDIVDMGAFEWVPPIYADASRPDDSGDGLSWTTAKKTLQAAVDASSDYGIIWVTNGVYDAGFAVGDDAIVSNRVVLSRGISIYSKNGASHTVIDGLDSMRCALLEPNSSLSGFTLRNGRTLTTGSTIRDRSGGGVFLSGGGVLRHCIIEDSEATNVGGGAYLKEGGTLDNCLLHNNDAGLSGGGAYISGDALLRSCTVTDNESLGNSGNGVRCYNGGTLQNSVVYNSAGGSSILSRDGVPVATFNYVCAPDGVVDGANGCLTANPALNDPANRDFSLASHSLCINAGTNGFVNTQLDLAGNRRVLINTVDMGAYEYIATLDTVYVDASRPDDSGTGASWGTAKKTLQAGVDTSATSGTVWVASGTYDLGSSLAIGGYDDVTNRLCVYKQIAVRSVDGASTTIIEALDTVRGVYLHEGCALDGFTVRNGFASGHYSNVGGGIFLDVDTLVENCVIEDCVASAGGGVWFDHGGTVNNCEISGCLSSGMGAAAYLNYDGRLEHCLIEQNSAVYDWANTVFLFLEGKVRHCIIQENNSTGAEVMVGGQIDHCLIVNNVGLGISSDGGTILNSTIAENRTQDSERQAWLDDETLMANCIVWNSLADETDEVLDTRTGTQLWNVCAPDGITHGVNGCITNNPQFVDRIDDDFRPAAGSACIDAGNNTFTVSTQVDLNGTHRMLNGFTDIGAYEFHPILGNDVDEDGMNDAWETNYFGSIVTCIPNDTNGDDDSFNNLEEFIAGTDPTRTDSAFIITNAQQVAEGFRLEWDSVSGRVYQVEWTPSLTNSFQPLGDEIPWPSASCLTTNTTQGFFRLNVKLAP
jgi:hypothetical protein